jgi:3-oxoacyl-[acyl-carrier protein] reductase
MAALPTDRASDSVAIVTGGSWGAGRELACALAHRGDAVVVVYLRDQDDADAVVEDILAAHGTALAVRADITDELDVARLFDETAAAFGGVDVLVHATRRCSAIVYEEASHRLRHGGAIVSVSTTDALTPVLVRDLRARDITINGLAPGLEPPGRDHDVADLVALLDRWRRSPGE